MHPLLLQLLQRCMNTPGNGYCCCTCCRDTEKRAAQRTRDDGRVFDLVTQQLLALLQPADDGLHVLQARAYVRQVPLVLHEQGLRHGACKTHTQDTSDGDTAQVREATKTQSGMCHTSYVKHSRESSDRFATDMTQPVAVWS